MLSIEWHYSFNDYKATDRLMDIMSMLNVCGWFYLFEKGRMNEQSAGRRGFDIRVYVHSNELQWDIR